MDSNNNKSSQVFQIFFGIVFITITIFIVGSAISMGIGSFSFIFVLIGVLFVAVGIGIIVQGVKGDKKHNNKYTRRNDISNVKINENDNYYDDITTSYKVVQNFCNNCGTKISDNDTYCPGCGKRIQKGS